MLAAVQRVAPYAQRAVATIGVVLAMFLGVFAQRRLGSSGPEALLTGIALYMAAALCLILVRQLLRVSPSFDALTSLDVSMVMDNGRRGLLLSLLAHWQLAAILIGVGIGLATLSPLVHFFEGAPGASSIWPLLGWSLSVVLVTVGWVEPRKPIVEVQLVQRRLYQRRREVLILLAIVLLGALFRLALPTLPPPVSAGGVLNVQELEVLIRPAWLMGMTREMWRVIVTSCAVLTLPFLYLLVRLTAGPKVALTATVFLALLPLHIDFGWMASPLALDPFFLTAALSLFAYGLYAAHTPSWPFVLVGLLAGLDQYLFAGPRLLPLLLFLFVGYFALLENQRLTGKARGILGMALVYLLLAAPIFLYAVRNPELWSAQVNATGIFQSGWLQQEQVARGERALLILWDQFRRSLFGFTYLQDSFATVSASTPLVPPLLYLGFFFGLATSLRHWRELGILLLQGWFWAILLAGGVLTANVPPGVLLVALAPPLCVFSAYGWRAVARGLATLWEGTERQQGEALLFLLFTALVAGTMMIP